MLYCLDVAREIDLAAAEAKLSSSKRTTFQHKRRAPTGEGITPPLRLAWEADAVPLGEWRAEARVELALYGFGALAVTWTVPFASSLEELVRLAVTLYDNAELAGRSRRLAEDVTGALGAALTAPRLAPLVEDYVCFQVPRLDEEPLAFLAREREALARVLRAEERALAVQEVDDAVANPVAYRPEELALVDWLGAILVGEDTEDERLVLELATVELLELRLLDGQLDQEVEEAWALLTRPHGLVRALTIQHRELVRIGRMQADDALLHDSVDNALKLFGDDYLARFYRTAAARFHFAAWDATIERKLGMLRNVYQSLADLTAHRRSELLEWIIILLIAVDIALYF